MHVAWRSRWCHKCFVLEEFPHEPASRGEHRCTGQPAVGLAPFPVPGDIVEWLADVLNDPLGDRVGCRADSVDEHEHAPMAQILVRVVNGVGPQRPQELQVTSGVKGVENAGDGEHPLVYVPAQHHIVPRNLVPLVPCRTVPPASEHRVGDEHHTAVCLGVGLQLLDQNGVAFCTRQEIEERWHRAIEEPERHSTDCPVFISFPEITHASPALSATSNGWLPAAVTVARSPGTPSTSTGSRRFPFSVQGSR
eukprot:m.425227 g.425227  ORF g.425227 m.425227 type:complete len:251 (-) comp51384_c0_seq1:140-892(-)